MSDNVLLDYCMSNRAGIILPETLIFSEQVFNEVVIRFEAELFETKCAFILCQKHYRDLYNSVTPPSQILPHINLFKFEMIPAATVCFLGREIKIIDSLCSIVYPHHRDYSMAMMLADIIEEGQPPKDRRISLVL